jgi:F0F1-type ATP synthase assembly protein I
MLSVGLSASFVGIFVQYQFFSTFYIMHVWFALGLIMAAYNIFRSETNAVLKTAPPACN